jgi:hypothetical protein
VAVVGTQVYVADWYGLLILSTQQCPITVTGDANVSSGITSADVITLVNYVFKGSTPPCDGCTSPLAASCP